jgi:hypothetical protein
MWLIYDAPPVAAIRPRADYAGAVFAGQAMMSRSPAALTSARPRPDTSNACSTG